MIKNSTWILLACLLAGGIYYGVLERRLPTTDQRQLRNAFVWRLIPDQVTYLAIEYQDFKVECERRREGWFLTSPVSGRADAVRIGQILNALEDLPRIETVTAADRRKNNTTLDAYELGAPRGRVIAEYGGRREELQIGSIAPVGDWLYVRMNGQDDVYVTSTNLLTVLPINIGELRERRFLHRDPRQATRLEIHRPQGFVQLIRHNNRWMLQQPVAARADETRVADLLYALNELTIETFVGDFRADPVAYQLSLDDAVAQVGLWWSNGEETGVRLFFGKSVENQPDLIYARRGDADTICTVPASVLETLQVKAVDLRDRALFAVSADDVVRLGLRQGEVRTLLERAAATSRWMLVEPVTAPADDAFVNRMVAQITALRADGFLDGATNAVHNFGETNTLLTIELGGGLLPVSTGGLARTGTAVVPVPHTGSGMADDGASASAADSTWQIRFNLGVWEGPPRQICAVTEGDRMAALLDRNVFDPTLGPGEVRFPIPVRSLDYRDRTVLSLDPSLIRRISRMGSGAGMTLPPIELGQDGTWRVVGDTNRPVNTAGIAELLGAVKELKAVRIVGDQPGDESRFQLDPPEMRITFGLVENESGEIQKSLLIGRTSAQDGGVAMVQGRDLIFILDAAVVGRLYRSYLP
jgi:hypothetical protein